MREIRVLYIIATSHRQAKFWGEKLEVLRYEHLTHISQLRKEKAEYCVIFTTKEAISSRLNWEVSEILYSKPNIKYIEET